jgi:hypothetical protein
MNASVTSLPPAGQPHDREDADMDGEGLTNGQGLASTVAVEVAAVDEDAMDTTPDADDGVLLANGSADPLETAIITPTSPTLNSAASDALSTNAQLPPADPLEVAVSPTLL